MKPSFSYGQTSATDRCVEVEASHDVYSTAALMQLVLGMGCKTIEIVFMTLEPKCVGEYTGQKIPYLNGTLPH
jgi:hypothetical protein